MSAPSLMTVGSFRMLTEGLNDDAVIVVNLAGCSMAVANGLGTESHDHSRFPRVSVGLAGELFHLVSRRAS